MRRLLTKKEEIIINSRVYDKLYREALAELYKEASVWIEKRNIKEYDKESGNEFKYFVQAGYDLCFDSRVKNTRARADQQPDHISIIKKYCDKSGYNYSGQTAIRWDMKNTDCIFDEAHRILVERNWNDLNDVEYFGYDPNDYI